MKIIKILVKRESLKTGKSEKTNVKIAKVLEKSKFKQHKSQN